MKFSLSVKNLFCFCALFNSIQIRKSILTESKSPFYFWNYILCKYEKLSLLIQGTTVSYTKGNFLKLSFTEWWHRVFMLFAKI